MLLKLVCTCIDNVSMCAVLQCVHSVPSAAATAEAARGPATAALQAANNNL